VSPRLLACLVLLAAPRLAAQRPAAESPQALLDRTIARMGGDTALRAIQGIRLDVITQWLRTNFATSPLADLPSYERNVDLRDYTTASWRNTRYFSPSAPAAGVVDVVRDTIAIRLMPRAPNAPPSWGPLNLAYVDERRELFAFAPERLPHALLAARDLRALPDTAIDGTPHARLSATLDGWPAVVFLRRSDALPVLVRFRADETNDFGLAPWAMHEVEFWYSGWSRTPPGVLLPRQRDVHRVGRPYKRMTVQSIVINPPVAADSFPVTDDLARAYLETERRPMWHLPQDTTSRLRDEHFAAFAPLMGSVGAVRLGGGWILLETGQAVGAVDRLAATLERLAPGARIIGGVAANPWTGNGGAPWLLARRLPVVAGPGAMPYLRRIGAATGVTAVTSARWVRLGTDSVWVEPLSAPDFAGTLAIYSPTLQWLYTPIVGSPAHAAEVDALITRLEARGWRVGRVGGARSVVTPR
jgi:hypothetical protein